MLSKMPGTRRRPSAVLAGAKDDGYLVGFLWDDQKQASYVTVFDAADIAKGPVCRIKLPQRVPNGFHATWVSGERLARGY